VRTLQLPLLLLTVEAKLLLLIDMVVEEGEEDSTTLTKLD
jgi:hypothetical protein